MRQDAPKPEARQNEQAWDLAQHDHSSDWNNPVGWNLAELATVGADIEGHISDEGLEEYSLDRVAESRVGKVARHLGLCNHCRTRLDGIQPVSYVHFTADGPVYSRATRLATGKVIARHWGQELDGGRDFWDVSAARRYLRESFSQMFPEHQCNHNCGPMREPQSS